MMGLGETRVLDLSAGPSAAYAGMLLAGLGAEVIRVESAQGSEAGHAGSRCAADAFHAAYHLGKKSVTLDLGKPAAREVFHRLVATADVLLEDLPAGAVEKLGAGYEDLKKIKPGLVYCSVSGYGRSGPYRDRECGELMAQARFGMLASNGRADEPVRTAYPVVTVGTGINAAFAITVALLHRMRTGEGQRVEATAMHTQMSFAGHAVTQFAFTGADPECDGTVCLQLAPYQAYRSGDGWVVVATSNQAQWNRIRRHPLFAGRLNDPRFNTMKLRVDHRRRLAAVFETVFRNMTAADVEKLFEELDVPCSRVNTLREVFHNRFTMRAAMDRVEHPGKRTLNVPKIPFVCSAFKPVKRRYPPRPGQHQEEELSALGYSREEIDPLSLPTSPR